MNKLKTQQEKANERYQAESIKPMYAFIIVCIAFLITAILQNIQYEKLKRKTYQDKNTKIFIPEDIARKARGIVKNDNVIKKLNQIAKNN